ncbi:DNA glycosylase [Epithele typhae]|uniref:DNA glycosylase n=1 Tax=Epithele typhae TaxID=378194 RepID=UPI0020079C9E|nr:DNA glycosylase [Epithele typhae]KAH9945229.1 DNA glycosylase [Epithele typhae]
MPRSKTKRPRTPSPPADRRAPASTTPSPQRAKKLKLLAAHTLESPFPDFHRPTPLEAADVLAILSRAHPDVAARRRAPSARSNAAFTCGNVPDVLESLVGTVLSQNTSSRNAAAAKDGLDAAFGRNDFAAIAAAPRKAVVAAIRSGGLANKKAGVVQNLLREVHARHGVYSLQHLTADVGFTDDAAMEELVSYDGVGPKTASCVLLFCLGRASFPVDTHVFRLSRLLQWVPPKSDRVTAQAHLDLTIPDDLKYGLHQLMFTHGKRCKGCKGPGMRDECVLKDWLREQKGVKEEEQELLLRKAEDEDEETVLPT